MPNIHGTDADAAVFAYIEALPYDAVYASKLLGKYKRESRGGEQLPEKERAIKNLTARLRECESSTAAKHIIAEIELLDAEVSALRRKHGQPEALLEDWEKITDFNDRRGFVNRVVEKIIWDGEGFAVSF